MKISIVKTFFLGLLCSKINYYKILLYIYIYKTKNEQPEDHSLVRKRENLIQDI